MAPAGSLEEKATGRLLSVTADLGRQLSRLGAHCPQSPPYGREGSGIAEQRAHARGHFDGALTGGGAQTKGGDRCRSQGHSEGAQPSHATRAGAVRPTPAGAARATPAGAALPSPAGPTPAGAARATPAGVADVAGRR